MTLFAFSLGVVLGAVGSALSIAVFVILEHGEDPLDSEEEYVDNTPTEQTTLHKGVTCNYKMPSTSLTKNSKSGV